LKRERKREMEVKGKRDGGRKEKRRIERIRGSPTSPIDYNST